MNGQGGYIVKNKKVTKQNMVVKNDFVPDMQFYDSLPF